MERVDLWQFLAAFVFVCGLIGLLALILRRYRSAGFALRRSRRRKPRLEVMETLSLDARHQAIILRRDQVQHLFIKTPDNVLLVESGFADLPDLDSDALEEEEDDETEIEGRYPRL